MSSDKKLQIVKNYKINETGIQIFESALKGLHEKPMDTEISPTTGEYKETLHAQMEKIIDICLLSLEMNLATMKNMLAVHIEHDLNDEIMNTKMEDKMNQAMKMMGLDPEKTRKLFGNDGI